MIRGLLLGFSAVLTLAACDKPADDVPPVTALAAEAPNSFLQFINTQASLPAGDYEVVAATAQGGRNAYYTLTITRDDGSVQTEYGQWTSSGGMDPDAAGNFRYPVTMSRAGGLKVSLTSIADAYIYLVRDGRIIAEDDNSGGGTHALLDLATNRISSVAYANAYYAAVDPDNERDTLDKYRRKNCFVPGNPDCVGQNFAATKHVVFRDSKDLGYGRNMYARRNTDGTVAFLVDNYVIRLQKGSSSNYGPINVEAAVREDRQYHVGTNAIEFSPRDPDDPGSELIAKFFTYNAAGERITSADLDGRGVKHMPGMCLVCHGGRLYPLEPNGDFPLISLRSAKYNILEVDSFDYADLPGWSLADQQAGFRAMNEYVHGSYQDMAARDDAQQGKWFADFAIEIADGRYGGPGLPEATYQTDHVPAGWQQTLDRPEGVEQLYKHVIEPHCIACHSLQGTNAGQNVSELANAINFSSWEKFYAYRLQVVDYVFRRGVMPLSLRNWEDFWRNPQDKPALLASFLDEPALFDDGGKVVRPGAPIARPGADRTTTSPAQLDGTASSFAVTYAWAITATESGETASLSDAGNARPVLTTSGDGDYTLTLTVTNALGASAAEEVVITIDSSTPITSTRTFVDDVAPLMGVYTGSQCASCHSNPSSYDGIPVSYDSSDNANVYRDVLARVNLAEPENSLLLNKPTGLRHGGGVQIDLDTLAGRDRYNTILEWIRAGAPCGVDQLICN